MPRPRPRPTRARSAKPTNSAKRSSWRGWRAALPGIPVVAEEAASRGDKPARGALHPGRPARRDARIPRRNGEFTVNIALIDDGVPVAGRGLCAGRWRASGSRGTGLRLQRAPGAALPPRPRRGRIQRGRGAAGRPWWRWRAGRIADAKTEAFLRRPADRRPPRRRLVAEILRAGRRRRRRLSPLRPDHGMGYRGRRCGAARRRRHRAGSRRRRFRYGKTRPTTATAASSPGATRGAAPRRLVNAPAP